MRTELDAPLMELDLAACRLSHQFASVFRPERHVTAEQNIRDDAADGWEEVSLSLLTSPALEKTYPVAQTSTGLPCPASVNTSGAQYPKLPATLCNCCSGESRCLALGVIAEEGGARAWRRSREESHGQSALWPVLLFEKSLTCRNLQ